MLPSISILCEEEEVWPLGGEFIEGDEMCGSEIGNLEPTNVNVTSGPTPGL